MPDIRATNEPKRQSCGAPDYILTKKEIPVGFIEAKDIGDKDLLGKKKTGNKEQFDRYKASLTNLIFTDYIDFHIYQDGEFITKIAIGEITEKGIQPLAENFDTFTNLIKDFATHISQNIKSSKKLAEMMAGKARLLSDVIEKALNSDVVNQENSTLKEQMLAFKDILIHDITPKGFADVYAQTIAYGMFAARLHDPTLNTFSRQEAAELIPKSNPFLRKLFGYIAGPDIDDRIKWIVENLSEIFLACNVEEILKNYGKATKMEDPIIHFYETFLAEYDPKLRKARGVWYTPAPIVNFIVRAVDDVLKTDFNLSQGLADTSKTTVKVKTDIADNRFKSGYTEVDKEVHKVQILDPATGTGTFLAEVIKHVHKKFKGQSGIWSSYAANDLLPRLNGFELLMASYAMAHLQIDLLLKETGYLPTFGDVGAGRTKIYLTNSLEEYHKDTGTLFANWLSSEANEANHIKRDTPVMCIIGNPPYSGESANKGDWIMGLMDDYKKEPGGKEKLKEQNSKFINDDYVKFLRYGQHYIEKNEAGVLAFINPHGFLDNPTFRGMRWNLLKTYDKIYTIDLHGNAKKKETAPDGSADINVFDIEQGVSINIFVKTGKKKSNELGQVFHYDLFGKRDFKYDFLIENSLKTIDYQKLPNNAPNYFMVQKDYEVEDIYKKGFFIKDLFPLNSLGLLTKRDNLAIGFNSEELKSKIEHFLNQDITTEEVCKYYNLVIKDKDKWDANITRSNVSKDEIIGQIQRIQYRPFDFRKVFYNSYFVARQNPKVLSHLINENIGLIICRQGQAAGGNDWNVVFSSKNLTDQNIYRRGGGTVFPLYLYPEETNQISTENSSTKRTPNLNLKIVNKIAKKIGLEFVEDHELLKQVEHNKYFSPLDLLDYIYAVLHSPTYREKYKEFLKIDFPRVPFPITRGLNPLQIKERFWQLVQLGSELRQLHLLESDKVNDFITNYTGEGDNSITRKITKTDIGYEPHVSASTIENTSALKGKVWINDTQYFDNVPLIAWEFYIGGYQPAQKWLKDRKGRVLEYDDIFHYSKIIVSLTETHKIMQQIDAIEIE